MILNTRSSITSERHNYAEDIIFTEEEQILERLSVKEESGKVGLKLNIQKTKIIASGPITSRQIDREIMETATDFIFPGLQNHCGQ